MTLKEFGNNIIVRAIPSVTFWSSFSTLFILGPTFEYDDSVFALALISIIAMTLINAIRGVAPPQDFGQHQRNALLDDPIYRNLPGNISHHNRW